MIGVVAIKVYSHELGHLGRLVGCNIVSLIQMLRVISMCMVYSFDEGLESQMAGCLAYL